MADDNQPQPPFFYSGYAPVSTTAPNPAAPVYAMSSGQPGPQFQPMPQFQPGLPPGQFVTQQFVTSPTQGVAYGQPMQYVHFPPPVSSPYPGAAQPPQHSEFQMVVLDQQANPIMVPYVPESIADRLTARDYQVTVSFWLDQAWELYRHNWLSCVIFTAVYLGVGFVPYVGGLLQLALYPGFMIAALHAVRHSRHDPASMPSYFRWTHLYHGVLWIFPVWAILLLYSLIVVAGLILLVFPGLYFMITMVMAVPLYLEFRSDGLGLVQSLTVSHRMLRKHFCNVLWLYLAVLLVAMVGMLLFGVGLLITLPVSQFMIVFALRDIFGVSDTRQVDKSLVCCC